MLVVVLTGAPGAGKTSVLTALMGLLEADHVRFAAIEMDALALAYPSPDPEAAFEHVKYLAASYRSRGYPTLLLTATIENAEYLRRLLAALPSSRVVVVRLHAPPALLRQRIRRREPPDWVGLARLVEAADTLAAEIASLPSDLVLSTEEADPRTVAVAVRHGVGIG